MLRYPVLGMNEDAGCGWEVTRHVRPHTQSTGPPLARSLYSCVCVPRHRSLLNGEAGRAGGRGGGGGRGGAFLHQIAQDFGFLLFY